MLTHFRSQMTPRPPYKSPTKRALMVQAHADGMSMRKVAKKFEVSEKAVRNAVKRYKETGHFKDRPRSGRPKKTGDRED